MRLNQFESLLDRHGASLDAWPSDAVEAAQALLASSAAARTVLAEAVAADLALRAELSRPTKAPKHLVDSIMARLADLPDEPPASAA